MTTKSREVFTRIITLVMNNSENFELKLPGGKLSLNLLAKRMAAFGEGIRRSHTFFVKNDQIGCHLSEKPARRYNMEEVYVDRQVFDEVLTEALLASNKSEVVKTVPTDRIAWEEFGTYLNDAQNPKVANRSLELRSGVGARSYA